MVSFQRRRWNILPKRQNERQLNKNRERKSTKRSKIEFVKRKLSNLMDVVSMKIGLASSVTKSTTATASIAYKFRVSFCLLPMYFSRSVALSSTSSRSVHLYSMLVHHLTHENTRIRELPLFYRRFFFFFSFSCFVHSSTERYELFVCTSKRRKLWSFAFFHRADRHKDKSRFDARTK